MKNFFPGKKVFDPYAYNITGQKSNPYAYNIGQLKKNPYAYNIGGTTANTTTTGGGFGKNATNWQSINKKSVEAPKHH
jgi:uncharacterized membrane protein